MIYQKISGHDWETDIDRTVDDGVYIHMRYTRGSALSSLRNI